MLRTCQELPLPCHAWTLIRFSRQTYVGQFTLRRLYAPIRRHGAGTLRADLKEMQEADRPGALPEYMPPRRKGCRLLTAEMRVGKAGFPLWGQWGQRCAMLRW